MNNGRTAERLCTLIEWDFRLRLENKLHCGWHYHMLYIHYKT